MSEIGTLYCLNLRHKVAEFMLEIKTIQLSEIGQTELGHFGNMGDIFFYLKRPRLVSQDFGPDFRQSGNGTQLSCLKSKLVWISDIHCTL